MILDDFFGPADMNTEVDIAESDDFTYLGMDPNISDSELPGDVSSPVEYDSSSDSDSDSATAELHPILEVPLEALTDEFDTAELILPRMLLLITPHLRWSKVMLIWTRMM
jgi:hypothetical protein